MSVIAIENLNKSFGAFNAVDNLNLTTKDGEFVVLVGPSGCGKTTTMRMIAGLEGSTSGSISIDGEDVTNQSPSERDVAMVFQNYALYPHLTVYENMAFCLRVRKWSKDQIDAQVRKTAKALDIDALLERKPSALSGGQRQRVALGRAIVREPRVFLMDEPLSNLDAKLRIEMRAEIVKLCRRLKITTFYVTHDQLEALTMGHRIVVMRVGVAQQIDTPQNIYDTPINRFVAGFIGSPPMNFLDAVIERSGLLTGPGFALRPDGGVKSALSSRSGAILAGVRPEHLSPASEGVAGREGTIRGRIELIEPLGSQMMIQVAVGPSLVSAQFERGPDVEVGRDITLVHRPNTVHAFDAKSERSVLADAQ
ncbi:ABC transporter ATP-binding protein [Sinorhizobium meliloti]|uniref:ABC transporter ATP-binding protein n=1 Tax=Rhizobium meliloti TaxID=382 RepID=UPI000FD59615|nr:ABC transporter ATP-binding protein [Sinorhizobium meliloti]MQV24849.1 sn-glycerol-3-phosphate ABC transporter ATP-binding protein UgpC [Sinorhizobium meliloti]MQV37481.1 sn-glycerol-3-phosphate ABC transporter ATP-binding protein UgpC [Sinorhizobium meliloti]RVE79220.1 ABC transporter ATP-binding protein [Sinorhizobium meliloti]RVG42706.1 ABC transporter ATP-binding protein [Sinorhizobium meliloti]RVM08301.1 ABC transporter ATP-binding protein [Sinorhizobium meliloti]